MTNIKEKSATASSTLRNRKPRSQSHAEGLLNTVSSASIKRGSGSAGRVSDVVVGEGTDIASSVLAGPNCSVPAARAPGTTCLGCIGLVYRAGVSGWCIELVYLSGFDAVAGDCPLGVQCDKARRLAACPGDNIERAGVLQVVVHVLAPVTGDLGM